LLCVTSLFMSRCLCHPGNTLLNLLWRSLVIRATVHDLWHILWI